MNIIFCLIKNIILYRRGHIYYEHFRRKKYKKKKDREMVYQLEGRPGLSTALPLGLQHVMAMFTSNLALILIIASVCGLTGADTVTVVQCAIFVSGLTTFWQRTDQEFRHPHWSDHRLYCCIIPWYGRHICHLRSCVVRNSTSNAV